MRIIYIMCIFVFLMAGAFAFNITSADYGMESFHWGLLGGNSSNADYSMRSSSDANQPTHQNVSSSQYSANLGWFRVSFVFPPILLTIVSDLTFINASAGHAFSASATVSDPMGGNAITSVEIVSTIGSCLQFSNSTSGVNFSAVFVCLSAVPATTNVYINFTDSTLGISVQTSTKSNTYPDHNATLSPPSISPYPAFNDSDLTCNFGTFSDPDGDLGNSQTWAWEKNGLWISGENTQFLNHGNFTLGDTIRCQENATNTVWTNSNGTAISGATIIVQRPTGVYLEIIGFLALICLAMFFMAETSQANLAVGMVGGVILVIVGAWALTVPIIIHTGDIATFSNNSTLNSSGLNITNLTTNVFMQNKTTTYVYTPIYVQGFPFNQIFGMIMILVGLLASFRYALAFKKL